MFVSTRISQLTSSILMPSLLMCGSLFGWSLMPISARADVGLLPTPTLVGVNTQTVVTHDLPNQIYNYNYTVTNPSSNTGQIWLIRVDMTTKFSKGFLPPFDSSGFSIPLWCEHPHFRRDGGLVAPVGTSGIKWVSGGIWAAGTDRLGWWPQQNRFRSFLVTQQHTERWAWQ
jgi:hypothetical protein